MLLVWSSVTLCEMVLRYNLNVLLICFVYHGDRYYLGTRRGGGERLPNVCLKNIHRCTVSSIEGKPIINRMFYTDSVSIHAVVLDIHAPTDRE